MTSGTASPGRVGRPPRLGPLALLAGLLALSAGLRLISGAEMMMARAADGPEIAGAVASDIAPPEPAPVTDTPSTLLEELRLRKAQLDERDRKLRLHEKALEVAETEIDEKLAALVAAEESLRETIALARGAAEADVARLTEVYSKMKPKNAAILFEEMAPEFAAGFLARMRPEAAAAIMAGLSPRRAYAISALLAARNAEVPRDISPVQVD